MAEGITFFDAAKDGELGVLKAYMDQHPTWDVNTLDPASGQAALHYAAAREHYDIATYLLMSNAAVNLRTGDGTTPLHLAAGSGDIRMVKLLVAYEADVCLKDAQQGHPYSPGETPISCAAENGHCATVQYLREVEAAKYDDHPIHWQALFNAARKVPLQRFLRI